MENANSITMTTETTAGTPKLTFLLRPCLLSALKHFRV